MIINLAIWAHQTVLSSIIHSSSITTLSLQRHRERERGELFAHLAYEITGINRFTRRLEIGEECHKEAVVVVGWLVLGDML